MIKAIRGRLFIELKGKFENFEENEERFGDSKMRGRVLDIAPDIAAEAKKDGVEVGSMVYFGKYEDTGRFDINGKWHVLIKLEEIGGVDNDMAVS